MTVEQGYIFWPDNPDKIQDSVRLEISDSKIELEYFEESSDIRDFDKVSLILGVFNGLGKVTLLDCTMSGTSWGGGANVKKYRADILLTGVHISSWHSLNFSKCVVNIPSLYSWVGIKAIKNRLWTEKRLYSEIPDEIKLATFEKYQLLFSFGYHTKVAKNEIHINQYTNFKIVVTEYDLHLNELIDIITHFKKFLLLVANENPISESITLFNNKYKYDNDQQLVPIELITRSSKQNRIQLSISATETEYKDLEDNFEETLSIWYNDSNLFSSVDLIIEKFINPKLSRENDFLNSCFAIETFHRRFKKISVYEKSEFKKIKKDIIDSIEDEEIKEFINEKLSYANEPTFRARLFDLQNDFKNILPASTDVEGYLIKIVKTRNYLVHRGSDKNTFTDFDMFYAARYIESVVRLCILKELKVSENHILKIVRCNQDHLKGMYDLNKKLKTSMPNIL
ncbi:HEPN domain-containing protein [Sunxiuqinia elliptica]|uniref:Uncharacterized protein n=1 Tax=Sunxiuqinia elliptica TaxID=655355 RepID=A0A4R6GQQ7_9BACT|nr:HEPN domain-containing protein [Sunxiuqinia elliptica]TDN97662.1 hypothetical protein DET52_10964 [Sunxiuqinia elliptica]TDO67017.1 hypothetical protein DET65_0384 [Sunxiuqinia elliptica]